MSRIITIQWLRGVAAMMVVWFHAIFLVSEKAIPSWQTDFFDLRQVGAAGVDVFFVISGFIMAQVGARAASPWRFLRDRWLRIWPMYAIATLAYVAVSPPELEKPGRILASLAFMEPYWLSRPFPTLEPGWTLMFEMAFYLTVAAALLWRSPRGLAERVTWILVGLVFLGQLFELTRPLNILGNPIALEFLFGLWFGVIWQKHGGTWPRWPGFVLFVGGAVLLSSHVFSGLGGLWEALEVLTGARSWERVRVFGVPAALIVAGAVFRPQPSKSGLLGFLGDASFSIYLFHAHVIQTCRYFPGVIESVPADLLIGGVTVASVLVGCLCYVGIERPMMRKLLGWKRRRPEARPVTA